MSVESDLKKDGIIITNKLDTLKINIKEQYLPTFTRTGFTVVEWGGTIHK